MKTFFAVDLGATSGRTIIGQIGNNLSIELEEINRFPNHIVQIGSHFHWDIFELYRNILEGLKIVAQRNIKIESIGIDTWGCDFAMFSCDGQLLNQPFTYRDPHTDGAPEKFFRNCVERSKVYELTGIQVMNFNTLFQFYTLNTNGCCAYKHADKILFIPDALAYLLTGKMITEYTVATTAQIVNAKTQKLEPTLLEKVGLNENSFGRLVYPGEIIGTLRPEVQQITGLNNVPVIAVGGHDTASAVAAVPAGNENFAYLSSGTWSLMGIETKEPIISETSERLNFTNEGGVDGTIRVLKNICGMWLLERCRAEWNDSLGYGELIEMAQTCEANISLINPDDPAFANPTSMIKAIEDFCRNSGQLVPKTKGEFVRCIFDSLANRYRTIIEMLESIAGKRVEILHVIGGGSRNKMLNQLTADAIGIPVVAGPAEATAMGNIMVQAVASGSASSISQMRKQLANSSELERYEPTK